MCSAKGAGANHPNDDDQPPVDAISTAAAARHRRIRSFELRTVTRRLSRATNDGGGPRTLHFSFFGKVCCRGW